MGPRVLLAEDHPTNRKVVTLILEAVGRGPDRWSSTARQPSRPARAHAFDLILMDMQMPVMDGLTAIRLIRERERALGRPRTPILALTANAMPEHAKASAEAGADGHLSKPIAAAQADRGRPRRVRAPRARRPRSRRRLAEQARGSVTRRKCAATNVK